MTKQDLLAQLPPYPTNPKALVLAKQSLSDENIENLAHSLRARDKKLGLLDTALWTWVVLLVIGFLAMVAGTPTLSGQGLLWSLLLLAASLGLKCYLELPLSLLPQLAPLKGTSLCEKALQLVSTGGPNVAEWRRIALGERNQLYGFDYNVMYLLAAQHFEVVRETARHEALDKACRALHEVP